MNVNELVIVLAGGAARASLDDKTWQYYGYKKRPKHGNWWDKFFPGMFELENFILRKFLVIGLIDVLNGIKKSAGTVSDKTVLSMGVIDQLLHTTKNTFLKDLLVEDLFFTYDFYLKNPGLKKYEQIISEAKNILDKDNCQKFMEGTTKLLLFVIEGTSSDFLLDSDQIKNLIEKEQPKIHTLKMYMSDRMYEKYAPLVKEKILDT